MKRQILTSVSEEQARNVDTIVEKASILIYSTILNIPLVD